MSADSLETELRKRLPDEIRSHWGRVFRPPVEVQEIGRLAYNLFLADNALFSLRADYLGVPEQEVLEMCLDLVGAPEGAWASFTSGGSESIYSALHAIREWAKSAKPGLRRFEVIAPYSAHPTFSKGCHYLGLDLKRVPIGADLRADAKLLRQAVTENTVAVIGSAPGWSYGRFDDILALGAIAEDHDLWLHVDACVGGYLAPFVEELGVPLPRWDFRVPAVRSISADLHKFGYCPKPASTVLWRSSDYQKFHYVHPADWPGGAYRTQGFAGSRSAGPIFAAWATMKFLGRSGYARLAGQVMERKKQLSQAIGRIEGLFVLENDLLPLCFGAETVDLGTILTNMRQRGWLLVASSNPPLVQLPIDPAADDEVVRVFLEELTIATREARSSRKSDSGALHY